MQLRLIRPRAGNREVGWLAHEICSRKLRESEALDGVQLKCVYFVIYIYFQFNRWTEKCGDVALSQRKGESRGESDDSFHTHYIYKWRSLE